MSDHGIAVVVVSGGAQTGKTTLIRQLLQASIPASSGPGGSSQAITVVVSTHDSMLLPPGALHWPVQSTGASFLADCSCCGVQGDLVDALRNLFMQSVQRRIPVVTRVIVELDAADDPALVMSTIRFDRFLGERFRYVGCVMVSGLGRASISAQALRNMARQAALADIVLLDQDYDDTGLYQRVFNQALPESAGVLTLRQLSNLDSLVERLTFMRRSGVRRIAGMGHRASLFSAESTVDGASGGVTGTLCVSLFWTRFFSRKELYSALNEMTGHALLPVFHVSGRVRFESGAAVFNVCVVHRQIYPFDQVMDMPDPADPACCLAFMAHGCSQSEIQAFVQRFLPEGQVFL